MPHCVRSRVPNGLSLSRHHVGWARVWLTSRLRYCWGSEQHSSLGREGWKIKFTPTSMRADCSILGDKVTTLVSIRQTSKMPQGLTKTVSDATKDHVTGEWSVS